MEREAFFERYGLSCWLYMDRGLEEALPKMAGAGFKHVELWADQAHLDPRVDPDLKEVDGLLRRLGLSVYSVHLPFSGMDLGSPDASLKDTWLRLAGRTLEYCAQLRGRIAVVHASGGKPTLDGEELERSRRLSVAFVQEVKSLADRLGIRLALENLLFDWSQFGRSLAELAQIFTDEEVGFCLDTGHALVNRVSVAAELQAAGPRLLEIHADNNDGLNDQHLVPSQGALDWQEVEGWLDDLGYRACRMLEVHGMGDPDGVLRQLGELWRYI